MRVERDNHIIGIKNCFLIGSVLLSALIISGCSDNLSEEKLNVINQELPANIYSENIESRVEAVYDYLWDAVEFYTDQLHDQTQSKLDDYEETQAFWGTNIFDDELFGTSATEQCANRYYRFTEYADDHSDDYTEDMKTICQVLMKHPEVVDEFFSGTSPISLELFASIEGMPQSINSAEFKKYQDIELNKGNRVRWGELVMGSLKQPHYSPLALVCASVIRVERLKYPKPVYAVYKDGEDIDDEGGWEVGYDTNQAYFVTFNKDVDVLEYTYDKVDYFEDYIESKKNKLR